MLKKLWRSTIYSWQGLRYAYTQDKSFRLEVRMAPVFAAFGFIFWPLSPVELLFLTLSYLLILICELLNTAIEALLLRLHPEKHELIGAAKDTASAAVLLCILFSVFTAAVIAANHLL